MRMALVIIRLKQVAYPFGLTAAMHPIWAARSKQTLTLPTDFILKSFQESRVILGDCPHDKVEEGSTECQKAAGHHS
ncbi:hypothetical protein MUG91_G239n19 [Manis pentadactyla]|nr:hypothetical protein MUG91_G239n19 [Manis pentadactyla]